MSPIGFVNGRYELPATPYFDELRRGISLADLAVYAEAEQRAELLEHLLERRLRAPLSGPLDYSPGGAAVVERARVLGNSDNAAGRWNRAAIFSPGTAILGLGQAAVRPNRVIMAGAGGPIMTGKSAYFLMTAGVNAEPITVETPLFPDQVRALEQVNGNEAKELLRKFRAENFAYVVAAQANNYGFINIEDAAGQDLPIIWGALEAMGVDSVYWSDDRQGTGVITAAAVLSWAEQTGRLKSGEKPLEGIRVVIFGAGAGARGVYDELINHGVRPEDILATDSGREKDRSGRAYPLHEGREDVRNDPFKWEMTKGKPPSTKVREFAKGADIVINLGVKETWLLNLHWTRELTEGLAANPLFLALTNPDPGITPDMLRDVRADAYYGSGNQRFPNPVNNFVAFGYNGLAALLSRARTVNREMTVAAARGIHEVARMGPPDWLMEQLPPEQRKFGRFWLVPHPLDVRLIGHEAGAAAVAAVVSGVSTLYSGRPTMAELDLFKRNLAERLAVQTDYVLELREKAERNGPHFFRRHYGDRYAPFRMGKEGYDVAPEIEKDRFAALAREMGVVKERWQRLLDEQGSLKPTALTDVLNELREGLTHRDEINRRGLAIIADTAPNDPSLGPALAQLRAQEEGASLRDEINRRELQIILQIAMTHPSLGLALAIRRTRVRPENLPPRPTLFHREEVMRVIVRERPEAVASIEAFKRWVETQRPDAPGGGADNPSRPSPGLRGENQSGGPVTPAPQQVDVPSDKTPAPRDSEKGMLVEHPQARADRIMAKVRQGSVKLEDDGGLALALKQKRDVGAQFIAPEEDAANNNDYYGNSPPPPLKPVLSGVEGLRGGDGGSYVVDDDVIPEEAANNEDYYVESEEEETGETLESTELQDEAPSSVLLPQTGSLWGAGPALGVGSVLLGAGVTVFAGNTGVNPVVNVLARK